MKGKQHRNTLSREVRAAKAAESKTNPRSRPERAKNNPKIQTHVDGKINLVGFYEQNLRYIQNDRNWNDSLCRSYDRVMHGKFGRLFERIPLEDMDEEDYLRLWDEFIAGNPTTTEHDRAYMLIRYLARLAFDQGVSDVIFWGDLNEEITERNKKEERKTGRVASKRQMLGLRIARSLPLESELRLLISALELVAVEGAALAGILIFLLAFRTSEACGARYGDLVEVHPGYWAIKRYMLLEKGGKQTVVGSKTKNGYRLVPLPRFLAALIRERRKQLEEMLPDKEIENLTIACSGSDYTKPADQKLVNRLMSDLYQKEHCDEALMMLAIRDFREDHELKEDCEKSLVAYLGRHQMMTEMVAVGLPERYIFAVAGHAQKDSDADIADLSNPDVFIEVSNCLNRRPVIWVLDHSAHIEKLLYDGHESISKLIDSNVEVHFDCNQQITLIVQEKEPLDEVSLSFSEGIEVLSKTTCSAMKLPVTKTIGNTAYLRDIAIKTYEKIMRERKMAAAGGSVHDADENTNPTPDGTDDEESFFIPIEVEPKKEEALPVEQIKVRKKIAAPEKSSDRLVFQFNNEQTALYVQSDTGTVFAVPDESLMICNRDTKGKKVDSKRAVHALTLYDPSLRSGVLTADGMFYPVRSEERLDKLLYEPEGIYLAEAFQKHAMLVSWLDEGSEQVLVCVTERGNIVCYQTDMLESIRAAGRKIVKLDGASDNISCACVCGREEDVLLVSAKGKGLRLASKDLPIRKTLESSTIAGIKIDAGDKAVACIPYGSGDFIFAKSDGMIAAVKTELLPHGRNSLGNRMVSGAEVVKGFQRSDAVAMLDSGGYLAVYSSEAFEPKNAGIKGVAAKKIRHGDTLIDACGLTSIKRSSDSVEDI